MTLRVPRVMAGALAVLTWLPACASPVHTEPYRAAREHRLVRVAVLPLAVRLAVGAGGDVGDGQAADASQLVTARVVEALHLWSALEIVPPSEVELWLDSRPSSEPRTPSEVGALLSEGFSIDAVLSGTVLRYLDRHGAAAGSSRPAAVSFELVLRSADGTLLWRGSYSEAQQGLSEDPGSLWRAAERRFRFVSAESLATYGARELIRGLDRETLSWR